MLHSRPESAASVFTQCSNCETIFKLSAEVLRAAGGQVRCGRCGEVFNALARLAEDADAFTVGESPLDMETRADQILESTAPPGVEPAAPVDFAALSAAPAATPPDDPGSRHDDLAQADVEFARLQVLESSMDSLLEFTVPPGELDRVFVDSLPRSKKTPEPAPAPGEPAGPNAMPGRVANSARTTLEDELARALETPLDLDFGGPAAAAVREAADASTLTDAADGAPAERRAGGAVDDKVWRDVLAGFEEAQLPEIAAPSRRDLPRPAWIIAAVLLAATLIGQIALTHRELLSTWHLEPPGSNAANLSVYQLRQWGVTGDPAARGTLRVRASILNTASQLAALPAAARDARESFRQPHRHARFRARRISRQAGRASCSRPASASMQRSTSWIRARTRRASRSTSACAGADQKVALRRRCCGAAQVLMDGPARSRSDGTRCARTCCSRPWPA